jgi:hypothetical protein
MSLRLGNSGTLDSGLLVQYLHGELDETGVQAVAGHVAACDACRSLVASLDAEMRRASDALRAAAWEQPAPDEWRGVLDGVIRTARSRQRGRRMRIAAGWILVTGAAASLASAQVRGWIAEKLAFDAEPTMPVASVQDPSGGHASLSFVPTRPELIIAVATKQTAGSLAIAFTDSARTGITVTEGGTEHLTWSGNGVRIANVADSEASYGITVSHGVERVIVRIGDDGPMSFDRAPPPDRSARVDLSTGTVRNDAPRDEQ